MARFGKTFGVTLLVVFVAAVSCSFGAYLGSASSGGTLPGLGGDSIAVIYVEGAIQGGEGGGLFSSDGAYSDRIIRWIGRAQQDTSVRAVVLRVDSPGGGVTASDEVYNALVKLKAVKPIVASFGSLAASGGYYISAPVNTIFANETSLTGSIGVITVVPNAQGLMEKLGVEVYTITSGDHKDDTSRPKAAERLGAGHPAKHRRRVLPTFRHHSERGPRHFRSNGPRAGGTVVSIPDGRRWKRG